MRFIHHAVNGRREESLFSWDEERRFRLRCELDGAFFHIYLPKDAWRQQPSALTQSFPTPRDAIAYVPIVKRKDEDKFNGEYRTELTNLEIYDAMAETMNTGVAYQTRLDPQPAREQ
jgi:hypothetical protein